MLDANVNMFSVLRKHFSAWRDIIETSGVSCKYIQLLKVTPRAAIPVLVWLPTRGPASQCAERRQYHCVVCISEMHISKILTCVFFTKYPTGEHLFICLAVNWKIEKNVVQYEQKFRGRELPGFINYRTFEEIVKEQIGQLEEPALLKLKEISGRVQCDATPSAGNARHTVFETIVCLPKSCSPAEIVRKELFKVAEAAFVGFPRLIMAAKVRVSLCTIKSGPRLQEFEARVRSSSHPLGFFGAVSDEFGI